jgi:hypothetical protein
MCLKGNLMAITRHGINRTEAGCLQRCSFEETVEILTDAAQCAEVDNLFGVTENVMLGRRFKTGTGYFELLLDHSMFDEEDEITGTLINKGNSRRNSLCDEGEEEEDCDEDMISEPGVGAGSGSDMAMDQDDDTKILLSEFEELQDLEDPDEFQTMEEDEDDEDDNDNHDGEDSQPHILLLGGNKTLQQTVDDAKSGMEIDNSPITISTTTFHIPTILDNWKSGNFVPRSPSRGHFYREEILWMGSIEPVSHHPHSLEGQRTVNNKRRNLVQR